MNLFMAIFWLTLAIAAFVVSWLKPGLPYLEIAGSGLNAGWLALVFGAYNLVRWLSTRMSAERKRMLEQMSGRRNRPRREFAEDSEPNPAFDFGDRPSRHDEGIKPGG